jgi:hypothetical protein
MQHSIVHMEGSEVNISACQISGTRKKGILSSTHIKKENVLSIFEERTSIIQSIIYHLEKQTF